MPFFAYAVRLVQKTASCALPGCVTDHAEKSGIVGAGGTLPRLVDNQVYCRLARLPGLWIGPGTVNRLRHMIVNKPAARGG